MTDTLLRNASLGELSANLSKMLRTFILSGTQSVGAMLPPAAKFAVSAPGKRSHLLQHYSNVFSRRWILSHQRLISQIHICCSDTVSMHISKF